MSFCPCSWQSFFVLSVNVWGACYSSTKDFGCFVDQLNCTLNVTNSDISASGNVQGQTSCRASGTNFSYNYNITVSFAGSSGTYYVAGSSCSFVAGSSYNYNRFTLDYCNNRCEADSLKCIQSEGVWNSANCQCGTNSCQQYEQECQEVGGTFNGTSNGDCCRASCNVCNSNAMNSMYDAKAKICCENGQAPPNKDQTCMTVQLPTSGCGMVYSSYGDFTSGGWNCQDPSSSFEAGSRYASQCLNRSSSSNANSSSSGGGSSSSGDGGNCPECEILEEILDTLISQKETVEDIYSCLTSPVLCARENNDSISIPEWVREKFDTVIDNQHQNYNRLGRIDTTLNYMLDSLLDSLHSIIRSDSLTRESMKGITTNIDSALKASNDTTKKILRHIAENISNSSDTLVNHIDNGFGLFGEYIDSSLKYYQQALKNDSIYNDLFGDSFGDLNGSVVTVTDTLHQMHESILGIANAVSYNMGYGDTATSTLRNDINALGDTFSKYMNGASVDTSGVGYGSGFVSEGERLGDSIGRAVGWIGGLDGVNIDSVFAAGTWGESGVDSVNDFVNDTLGRILDSLHLLLKRENDSVKGSLPDSLTVWADSLIKVSPFVSFDSLIYSTIGAKIPNSDQCPEDCQSWSLNLPRFGLINYTVDFGLCLGRVPLGGLNVLSFLRLIIRLVIVWSCISIVMWTFSNRKM